MDIDRVRVSRGRCLGDCSQAGHVSAAAKPAERLDAAARGRDDEESAHRWTPNSLATGKSIFKDKCQKCHGASGKGDGPDADPDAQEDMDLTRADRAAKNPDGVVFFKVFNGRKKPKMTAQKDELSKDQIWAGRRVRADAAEDGDEVTPHEQVEKGDQAAERTRQAAFTTRLS